MLLPVILLAGATAALAALAAGGGHVAAAAGIAVGIATPAVIGALAVARSLATNAGTSSLTPGNENEAATASAAAAAAPLTGRVSGTLSPEVAASLGTNIMSAANDAVIVIDSRCRILAVNARAEAMFGYRAAALLGRNVKMLMPKRYAEEHDEYVAQYLRSGRANVIGTIREVAGMTAAGDEIPCELSLSSMRVDGGVYFVGMLRDIRARREADARIASQRAKAESAMEKIRIEEYRSKQIMDIANDAVILIDSRCSIVSVNKMTLKMFQVASESELVGRNVNILMPPAVARVHDSYIERYLYSGRATVAGTIREVHAMRPGDMVEFPIELSMNDVVIGAEHYFVGMIRDITTRKAMQARLDEQMKKTESLLRNMLPESIAQRLMERPAECIADRLEGVAILFADIVEFTPLAGSMDATKLVELLNQIFTEFDALAGQHGLEKIKTLGDAFMCAAGLPGSAGSGGARQAAMSMARMALDMHAAIASFRTFDGKPFRIRVGIHLGTVVAGVIGKRKYLYDLWGDAVNVASRMESSGVPGRTQVTHEMYTHLRDGFVFEDRGKVYVKGKGEMRTYFLVGRASTTPRQSQLSMIDPSGLSSPGYNALEGLGARRLDSWDFTPSTVAASLFPALFREMLVRLQLVDRFRVRERELRAFTTAVVASYRQLPFHNAARAIDCAHLMYLILRRIPVQHESRHATKGEREGSPSLLPTTPLLHRGSSPVDPEPESPIKAEGRPLFSELERFALMIATLCMDLDHPGVSKNFLCESHAPLAILYCNRSPLEQHHAAKALTLLEQKSHAITAGMEPALRRRLNALVVDCILSTDVEPPRVSPWAPDPTPSHVHSQPASEGGILGSLSPLPVAAAGGPSPAPLAPPAGEPASSPMMAVAAAALMQCAHYGTSARSFEHAKFWAALEMQERLEEGRLLAEVGAEVPAEFEATDAPDMGAAAVQVDLVASRALPAFEAAARLFHGTVLDHPLGAVRRNLSEWRALHASFPSSSSNPAGRAL
eukprot:tig00021534_g22247.t1